MFVYNKPKKNEAFDPMTIQPIHLLEDLTFMFSKSGPGVSEPFLGCGTTAVAAENTQRKFIGFGVEPRYFQMAICRIKHNAKTG